MRHPSFAGESVAVVYFPSRYRDIPAESHPDSAHAREVRAARERAAERVRARIDEEVTILNPCL